MRTVDPGHVVVDSPGFIWLNLECAVNVVLIALLVALGIAAPANAEPFEDGLIAYRHADYAAAMRFWRPLAEAGDTEAQYSVGVMYHAGQGVEQDFAAALSWYRKAVEKGFAAAQYQLGNMYQAGTGVAQSYTEALHWYRKAAAQGASYAQRAIGLLYENGNGVAEDYVEAMRWYRLAEGQEGKVSAGPPLSQRKK